MSVADSFGRLNGCELAKTLMNACHDPVFIADEAGRILLCNNAAARLFGYNLPELPGHSFSIFLDDDEFENYRSFYAQCTAGQGGNEQGQGHFIHMLSADRQKVKAIVSVAEHEDPSSGAAFTIIVAKDLSEELRLRRQKNELEHHYTEMLFSQSHYEEQAAQVIEMAEKLAMEKDKVEESKKIIEHQASHDQLTELGNRILMHKAFPELLTRAKACCGGAGLIYIDLDNFKAVNDRLGHNAGDRLLCDVAARLRKNAGAHDIAIRLGGDEFAVIAYLENDAEASAVYRMAEKLLEDLRFNLSDEFGAIPVTASIGVALYPQDGHTLDMLLTHADTNMYDVKKSGKGRVR